ncbi:MAG: hypothetical protein ACREPR_18595 [Brasilonema sp.]
MVTERHLLLPLSSLEVTPPTATELSTFEEAPLKISGSPWGFAVTYGGFRFCGAVQPLLGITGIHTSVFLVLKLIIDSDSYDNYGSKDSL